MEKTDYEQLKIEIIQFESEEVIVTSGEIPGPYVP